VIETNHYVCLQKKLCVSLQSLLVIFVIAKKACTMFSFCNYFVCVFATRSYLWLQHDCVCVVKAAWLFWLVMIASLNSVWLQQQVRCDCKKNLNSVSLQLFCMCHCKHSHGNFVIAKKRQNNVCLQLFCVCVWLQPKVICGCNMTVSVWLKLLDYLVIYDCKPK
jgi:hypothetical protein